jgi:hypothetical protein
LLDMSARWGLQKYLIVVNTHLDPSNRTSQKAQMIEIAQVRTESNEIYIIHVFFTKRNIKSLI